MNAFRSILVAGGATGIGAAVAAALADAGHRVTIADINEAVVQSQQRGGGAVTFVRADLARPEGNKAAVEGALRHGGGRLDAVVHTAGVLHAAPLAEWTLEDWRHSLDVNLTSAFLLTQYAAAHLRQHGCGRVVMTSSTGAFRGHAGMPAYHAAKAALLGLARSLADELGPDGVTVNAVCPGWIDTSFNDAYWAHQDDPAGALRELVAAIPARRQGNPADVAGAVMFLLSDAAAYVNGQSLIVDGGYTAV